MKRTLFFLSALLAASCLYAVDGVVLINQATVTSCSPLPPSGFAAYGLRNTVASLGTTVLNGSVHGFTLGLYLNGGSVVKDIHSDSNYSTGIIASGNVSNSTATGNGVEGMYVFGTANFAAKNGFAGIGGWATFSGNTASQNGSFGFSISCPSAISGNTAFLNRFASPGSDPTCVASNNIFQ